LPSWTDPAIRTFDDPHYIYVNREIVVSQKPDLPPARHQLLLFIPGTHTAGTPPTGKGPSEFLKLAANLGYHVVVLHYPNDKPAAVCNLDRDPKAFEQFRNAILAGGSSKHITVERPESLENRLVKLLVHLKDKRPREHWEEFLHDDGSIKWRSMVVAGQSQGGGHAALIAIQHEVARVICTGAPKDYSHALLRPAAWYSEPSATPKSRFFAFNHDQDHMGNCSPAQQAANLEALGLNKLGSPASVDTEPPPYRHTRILQTNCPGHKVAPPEAHATMIANKNAGLFRAAWTYLLTEPAE